MSEYQTAAYMPPPPETLSAKAREYMAAQAGMAVQFEGPLDLAIVRPMIEAMQGMIAAEQQKAHPVTVTLDEIGGVPVRRMVKADGAVDRTRVLMNVHGGGFAIDAGSLTENIPLAHMAGIEVVAVVYRLAPEHPFPAAVDDALAVYKGLLATYDPRDIAVYGTSAGAVIGPQLMMRLKAEGLPMPGALGVFSGEANLEGVADSLKIFAGPIEGNLLVNATPD